MIIIYIIFDGTGVKKLLKPLHITVCCSFYNVIVRGKRGPFPFFANNTGREQEHR